MNKVLVSISDVRKISLFATHLPIFQGDSISPHIETTFIEGIAKMCEEEGWHW